eukprot:NODE_126_length_17250_cov_2.558743.p7 type:complete len:313 gc:universal NODE_126_length_17250_cov_2.558743:12249-13187(+)
MQASWDLDSFAMVDELIETPVKQGHPENQPRILPYYDDSEADENFSPVKCSKSRMTEKNDILERLMNQEHKKQTLISQHHNISEKLLERSRSKESSPTKFAGAAYKRPSEYPVDKKLNSQIPVKKFLQNLNYTPIPEKNFKNEPNQLLIQKPPIIKSDSKYNDWKSDEGDSNIELKIDPSTQDLVQNHVKKSMDESVQVEIHKDQLELVQSVSVGIQFSTEMTSISVQAGEFKPKPLIVNMGTQTNLDYFDPLLSLSKLSIKEELEKPAVPMEKLKKPNSDNLLKNITTKKIPNYKQMLLQRFIKDVHKLMD